ncbi:hypothetical protein U0070_021467 [Myodes glareolus]|uniref:Uncharacterized protein n=1 Tax=Myodes glareolus TaxID=447135 RepID=A0AAW0JE79_MYOGA
MRSPKGKKEVRAKSSDCLSRFGDLKRAHIFLPTSIELPSTLKGPKWRAKGSPRRGDCSAPEREEEDMLCPLLQRECDEKATNSHSVEVNV